jgi:hypothetical protein
MKANLLKDASLEAADLAKTGDISTMRKKDRMYVRISQHGNQLLRVFPNAIVKDPIALCKALCRCEVKLHAIAEEQCNGNRAANTEALYAAWEASLEHRIGLVQARVGKLLGMPWQAPLRYNGDPRGYAIKIESSYMVEHSIELYRDWGGYGIVAPNFSLE